MGTSRMIARPQASWDPSTRSRWAWQQGQSAALMRGYGGQAPAQTPDGPGWIQRFTSSSDTMALRQDSALYRRRRSFDMSNKRDVPMGDNYRPDHAGIPYLTVALRRSSGWASGERDSVVFAKELFTTVVWLLYRVGARVVDLARQYCSRVLYTPYELRKVKPYKRGGVGGLRPGTIAGKKLGRRQLLASRAANARRATKGPRSRNIAAASGKAAMDQQAAFISPRSGWFLAGWQARVVVGRAGLSATLYLVNTRRAGNGKYLQEYFYRGTSRMIPRPIHRQLLTEIITHRHLFRPLNVLTAAYGGRAPAQGAQYRGGQKASLMAGMKAGTRAETTRSLEQSMAKIYGGPYVFAQMSSAYDPFEHSLFGQSSQYNVSQQPLAAASTEQAKQMDQWMRAVIRTSTRFTHPTRYAGVRAQGVAAGKALEATTLNASLQRILDRTKHNQEQLLRSMSIRALRSPIAHVITGELANMTLDQFDTMMRRSGLRIDTYVGIHGGGK